MATTQPRKPARVLSVLASTKSVALEAIADRARTRSIRPGTPYVTSYGGGLDSVYIAERLIREPELRPFALEDWLLVMSQTGDEFRDIADYHDETGVLRDFASASHFSDRTESVAGPRFIQIARSGPAGSSVRVLEDSRTPTRLMVEGDYTLADEMIQAGSLPTTTGSRKCSLKSKGAIIDRTIRDYLGLSTFHHAFGFDRDELSRVARSEAAIAERNFARQGLRRAGMDFGVENPWWLDAPEAFVGEMGDYPMLRWDVSRAGAADWLVATLGRVSPRSCCRYCPFMRPWADATVLERWRQEPAHLVARALLMEHQALGLNPRMQLFFQKGSLRQWVENARATEAVAEFNRLLASTPFALWRVRRIFGSTESKKGREQRTAKRRTEKLAVGSRLDMERLFDAEFAPGARVTEQNGFRYAFRREQDRSLAVTSEELFVVAPALSDEKMNSPAFEQQWHNLHPDAEVPSGESIQPLLVAVTG